VRKQALIVGLGQFGLSLARALSDRGVEVLAVDRRQEVVEAAALFAAEAVALDATDEVALAGLGPRQMTTCVCAIGDESRDSAIIVTALLRQMGAAHVIARATDDVMARILSLVGAHEVVNPERAFGERLASRVLFSGIVDEIPLGGDLVLTELRPLPHFVGRSLAELELPRRHGVTVVALRRPHADGPREAVLPSPGEVVGADDLIVTVARRDAVRRLLEESR
jgi:trk system potassium uptake protein TrkA